MQVGEKNLFGMRVTAIKGRMLDLTCTICGTAGAVPASEFQSTRCGSARCASSQGRTE
jgi:hypothetical protein